MMFVGLIACGDQPNKHHANEVSITTLFGWFADDRLQGRVECSVCFVCQSIGLSQFSTWFGALNHSDSLITSSLHRAIDTTGDTGQQRSSKSRSLGCIGHNQFCPKHISNNLPPERTFSTATGRAQLVKSQPLLTNNSQTILQAKGNALQD